MVRKTTPVRMMHADHKHQRNVVEHVGLARRRDEERQMVVAIGLGDAVKNGLPGIWRWRRGLA